MENGSGLSRQARISAGDMVALLARADLAPGDLVFFQTGRHPNSHVGVEIYKEGELDEGWCK